MSDSCRTHYIIRSAVKKWFTAKNPKNPQKRVWFMNWPLRSLIHSPLHCAAHTLQSWDHCEAAQKGHVTSSHRLMNSEDIQKILLFYFINILILFLFVDFFGSFKVENVFFCLQREKKYFVPTRCFSYVLYSFIVLLIKVKTVLLDLGMKIKICCV